MHTLACGEPVTGVSHTCKPSAVTPSRVNWPQAEQAPTPGWPCGVTTWTAPGRQWILFLVSSALDACFMGYPPALRVLSSRDRVVRTVPLARVHPLRCPYRSAAVGRQE